MGGGSSLPSCGGESLRVGNAAVSELATWVSSLGPMGMIPSMPVGWIICITSGHVGRRGGDSNSRVNIASVDGDIHDRGVVIYRWRLIIVRGGTIFIDVDYFDYFELEN